MIAIHRRRIRTEEKAKIVAAVWGGENFFNSLTRKLFSTKNILKNRMNSSFSSNHPGEIHPCHPLPSPLSLFFFYDDSCLPEGRIGSCQLFSKADDGAGEVKVAGHPIQ